MLIRPRRSRMAPSMPRSLPWLRSAESSCAWVMAPCVTRMSPRRPAIVRWAYECGAGMLAGIERRALTFGDGVLEQQFDFALENGGIVGNDQVILRAGGKRLLHRFQIGIDREHEHGNVAVTR